MLVKGSVRLLWNDSLLGREFTFNLLDGDDASHLDMCMCFLTMASILSRHRKSYCLRMVKTHWRI